MMDALALFCRSQQKGSVICETSQEVFDEMLLISEDKKALITTSEY